MNLEGEKIQVISSSPWHPDRCSVSQEVGMAQEMELWATVPSESPF